MKDLKKHTPGGGHTMKTLSILIVIALLAGYLCYTNKKHQEEGLTEYKLECKGGCLHLVLN
jgi:hypothetical protein